MDTLTMKELRKNEHQSILYEGRVHYTYNIINDRREYSSISTDDYLPPDIQLPEGFKFVLKSKEWDRYRNVSYSLWYIISEDLLDTLITDTHSNTINEYFRHIRYDYDQPQVYITSVQRMTKNINVLGIDIPIYNMTIVQGDKSYIRSVLTKEFIQNMKTNIPGGYKLFSPDNLSIRTNNNWWNRNQRAWFVTTESYIEKIRNAKNSIFVMDNINKFVTDIYPDSIVTVDGIILFNKEKIRVDPQSSIDLMKELEIESEKDKQTNLLEYVKDISNCMDDLNKARFTRNEKSAYSDKFCLSVVRDYYEDCKSITEITRERNGTYNTITDIIHYSNPRINDILKYYRVNRKRPLSNEDYIIINIFKDLHDGKSNEYCCKKYLMSENIVNDIGKMKGYAKNVIQYATDNNILGNTVACAAYESNLEIEQIISKVMYRELASAIFGEKTSKGNTIPYIVVVNVIKDYYEKVMDIEDISKKYKISEGMVKSFIHYKGKFTHKIMTHIKLDRKRPLTNKENIIVKVYKDIMLLGEERTAKKYKTTVDKVMKIKNKEGYSKNIIEYAQANNLM